MIFIQSCPAGSTKDPLFLFGRMLDSMQATKALSVSNPEMQRAIAKQALCYTVGSLADAVTSEDDRMEQNLTMIDLFSGCGGVTTGFKAAGFQPLAAVEYDHAAAQTYRLNHPEVVLYEEDIRNISPDKMMSDCKIESGQLTVLSACSPCQPFSTLNRSKIGYERAFLILEVIRFAEKLQPKFLFMENVSGLKKDPKILDKLVSKLKELGYKVTWAIIDAVNYGVPQFRKRLILLSTIFDVEIRIPDPTHAPTEEAALLGILGQEKWLTVRDAFAGLQDLNNGEASETDPLHKARKHAPLVLERLKHIPHDGGSRKSLPPELQLPRFRDNNYLGYDDIYGRMAFDKPSNTLTTGCTSLTQGRFAHPTSDRSITLREAARLQTFPDSYRFYGSYGQIATQIGNAVPVRLAEVFAHYFRQLVEQQICQASDGSSQQTAVKQ